MPHASAQLVTTACDEHDLWLPPRRMLRYQIAKFLGALVVAGIFVGWLVIQWSNPVMRVLTLMLLALTVWVTLASILGDFFHGRGRQLALRQGQLTLRVGPLNTVLPLSRIALARWREDDYHTAGLWLLDRDEKPLAHLDLDFLADQDEARAFLRWARQRAELNFPVHWPDAA